MPVTLPSGPILHFDTTAQRTGYSSSALAEGQLCYDQQTDKHYRWDGSAWNEFGAGGGAFSVGSLLTGAPPTNANYMVWRAPYACTVTNVRAHFDAGTSVTVNARLNQTSTFLSSNFTHSTANAWGDGGAVQNTAIAIGDDIEVMLIGTSGAVTKVNIQVDLTRP